MQFENKAKTVHLLWVRMIFMLEQIGVDILLSHAACPNTIIVQIKRFYATNRPIFNVKYNAKMKP